MLTTTKNYYISATSGLPYEETVITNPAGKVVSSSNKVKPGDTPTTQMIYNTHRTTMTQAYNQAMTNASTAAQQKLAQMTADKAAATPALLSVGLTQQQIDSIFGV